MIQNNGCIFLCYKGIYVCEDFGLVGYGGGVGCWVNCGVFGKCVDGVICVVQYQFVVGVVGDCGEIGVCCVSDIYLCGVIGGQVGYEVVVVGGKEGCVVVVVG